MLVQSWARKERKERNKLHCPLEFDLLIVHLLQFILILLCHLRKAKC